MDKVIKLLNGSISKLNRLENEIKLLEEDEFDRISSCYPYNEYFHEVVTSLRKWKNDIENSDVGKI